MMLPERYKNMLIALFTTVPVPIEVWAYGSRVTGSAHAGSDLDLVVLAQHNEQIPTELLASLQKSIRESNIPILVEVRDFYSLPERFRKNIEAQHEVIFSNVLRTASEPHHDYQNKKNTTARTD